MLAKFTIYSVQSLVMTEGEINTQGSHPVTMLHENLQLEILGFGELQWLWLLVLLQPRSGRASRRSVEEHTCKWKHTSKVSWEKSFWLLTPLVPYKKMRRFGRRKKQHCPRYHSILCKLLHKRHNFGELSALSVAFHITLWCKQLCFSSFCPPVVFFFCLCLLRSSVFRWGVWNHK